MTTVTGGGERGGLAVSGGSLPEISGDLAASGDRSPRDYRSSRISSSRLSAAAIQGSAHGSAAFSAA